MQIRQINSSDPPPLLQRKKVAAYARVSSGKDAMLHSLAAQISYYSDYIAKYPDWEFSGCYVDEAKTGTRDDRPGFQKMLDECRAGRVQLVLTKSISRFARNTATVLAAVRELNALGVDVFFEDAQIHSLSAEGELLLTLLASFAQEYSRSASENQKWRVRKDFREGRVSGMKMLGYHLIAGRLVIIPEEAEVVQQIFDWYLEGHGLLAIQKKLRARGVKLSETCIRDLLRNEKCQGDMRLQKSFVQDHISKRKVKNIGQLPQFYVTDSHEGIISREQFAAVQHEIAHRADVHAPKPKPVPELPPPSYPFTGLLRCGKCGAPYRRKHANAGSKYEKIVWICDKFNTLGRAECDNQQIPEDILIAITVEALGLQAFDEQALRSCVTEILVPGPGQLTYIFLDGHTIETTWQHRSRRESWTPEMREMARQKALAHHRGESK
ncbi:MAG: recombinase family protein [Oscillospiraceae bacterium]|jgi:DNA invertase Pin-like site-specific DNA recombinase|nr:recombinase family protein [Oscillospiraceae bacterium]